VVYHCATTPQIQSVKPFIRVNPKHIHTMGTGHLSPSGTNRKTTQVKNYDGYHIDCGDTNRIEAQRQEEHIQQFFCHKYGFKERDDIIHNKGYSEKVLCETGHNVQLRQIYHPSGTTVYYYMTVVGTREVCSDDRRTQLGLTHLHNYADKLKELLSSYGTVYRKDTAWTSTAVVEA